MDIDEYTPLFSLTFSAPVLDNVGAPSFGTLLSCLNVCLGYMQAVSVASYRCTYRTMSRASVRKSLGTRMYVSGINFICTC
jgi:hypothetical protein